MASNLQDFMNNPHYREIIENSPSKACREWIEKSLVEGMYCGMDPENPKSAWEKELGLEDWKYLMKTFGWRSRLGPKCQKRIAELEAAK